jgi:superfamily II DNA or RNA helicase
MPTGAGKTLTAAHIVAGARDKGNRVVFVVPAVELIDQTVEAFRTEGLYSVGVIQADHHLTDAKQPIQVASVQTLSRRSLPDTDVVIVDEAHRAFRVIFEWMKRKPGLLFIGLSATPWTRGLGKHYDDLIIAATTDELIDAGYLSPFRVFAPSHPDLSKVRTVAGDYHEDDLAEAMSNGAIMADIVSTWLKLGESRQTLCFGVNRAHAKGLQRQFEAAGVCTGYVDAFTDKIERTEIRKSFERGDIKIVCNVGVLTTGVDWDVRCLILARPTKSEMLYTQIIGRALRTAEGKADAIILDHSDTTLRLGFVTDIKHDRLDMGRMKESRSDDRPKSLPLPKECTSCNFLKPPKVHTCPQCGFAPEIQPDVEELEGELAQIKGKKKLATMEEKKSFYGQLMFYAEIRGFKSGWAFHKYKEKFGVEPAPAVQSAEPEPPTGNTLAWLKSRQIAWAKTKKKMEAQNAAA